METIILQLTKYELRALREALLCGQFCTSGCAYPEMKQIIINCPDCAFPINVHRVIKKVNKLWETN